MNVCGKDIHVQGQVVRIARPDGDKYKFPDDPKPVPVELRRSASRVDLFAFAEKLADTSSKCSYPMKWDNVAVVPLSSLEDWWTERIGFKARNKAKQAAKEEVVVRDVRFDDARACTAPNFMIPPYRMTGESYGPS